MTFAREMQVKQRVNEIRSPMTGVRFHVYETGDARYYLFRVLDPWGCEGGVEFPVRKADLTRDARRALRGGR